MGDYQVILGLGSNVGDRRQMLGSALYLLSPFIKNIKSSSVYESTALLPDAAPDDWDKPFYNIVISGITHLEPTELLAAIKNIESAMGRNKIGHWSPREIDIDILSFDHLVLNIPELTIPHQELHKRDFVLYPLAEIAPDWLHPKLNKTASELANGLPASSIRKIPRPKLVGIVNITPDSFSDGGMNVNPDIAIARIKQLIAEGADVIDIGAESTRPSAVPISSEEEWSRLEPVLKVVTQWGALISVDTRHPETARKALLLGVNWINDVSGFSNPDMVAAVQNSSCKLVMMHSLTVPADKNVILPLERDPIEEIIMWAQKQISRLEMAGIARERIIVDAGIGFGKNAAQSHAIIDGVERFKCLATPILIGHSRKSFLAGGGDDATIKMSNFLADKAVDYLRVHNISRHKMEML